jgi:hypothetical protein
MDRSEIKAFEALWHPVPNEYDRLTDKWQMPIVNAVHNIIPEKMMSFDEFTRKRPQNCGAHCFKGDNLLERLWSRPTYYGEKLKSATFVTMPDYSASPLMSLFPLGYNLFRAKRMAQLWTDMGLVVVPTPIWASPDTYDLCFAGMPRHSFLAISTVGTIRDPIARAMFPNGLRETLTRLEPVGILHYGPMPRLGFAIDVPIWHFDRKTYGFSVGYQEELF